jgi:two-component system, NarL family, nitrate/nitrite response regulator NarL
MHIVIADDHPLYREALHARLARCFPNATISEVASIDELLRAAEDAKSRPDLVLLDLYMPGTDHGRGIARVMTALSQAPVVLISGLASTADVAAAVQAGAKGFLPKTMPTEMFVSALMLIAQGASYVPADVFETPQPDEAALAQSTVLAALTPRELQVLARLATGASNKEIARDLGLAEVTVKLHVRQILKKTDARNRSEAAAIAVRANVV